ncbi:MAG: phosphoribosylanthranilate isomerase [Alphaproteobacteria bacterium]|nr:phosphoribosylanthranilate isomerase [Alphaproteobacteria bacterium]
MTPPPATPSPVQVKICGINSAEALETAMAAGADLVGFVFYPPSPRNLSAAQASPLSFAAKGVKRVGLFVDPTDYDLGLVLDVVQLDVLQLHGSETPARVAEIRTFWRRFVPAMEVMKAVGVATRAEVAQAVADYGPVADRFLFDAKPPPDGTPGALPGGNARAFDWTIVAGQAVPRPWLLAGGLTPDNVAEAIGISGAPGVDVSSGVERARGVKDPALIRAFIAAAKGASPTTA